MEIMFYFTTFVFLMEFLKKICGQIIDGKNTENKNEH